MPAVELLSFRRCARSIIDANGRGHTGRKNHARRHLIDMDADWDALGKAHPREDRVDRRHPLIVGLCVRDVDGASYAFDVAAYDLAVTHQADLGRISQVDGS